MSVDGICDWLLTWLDVIGRSSVSRDVIGREDCKKWLVRFKPSFVSQKSVGLLLVKCLLFVCLTDVVNKSFVQCRKL